MTQYYEFEKDTFEYLFATAMFVLAKQNGGFDDAAELVAKELKNKIVSGLVVFASDFDDDEIIKNAEINLESFKRINGNLSPILTGS